MATERLSMRMTREILRHKLLLGRTHRAAAASLGVSAGKVHDASAKVKRLTTKSLVPSHDNETMIAFLIE